MTTMTTPRKKRSQDRHKDRNNLSVPTPHYEQLKKLAAKNRRPITWEVRVLLEDALRAAGLWPPPPDDAPA